MTFEATKGSGFASDIAIDDVTLTSGVCSKFNICLCHIIYQVAANLIAKNNVHAI